MQILDWDDFRLLLAVAREGSFFSAARQLGVNHTTVSRRMAAFEKAVGAQLIQRSRQGVALTAAGTSLLPRAERMEAEMRAAFTGFTELDGATRGTVRLATPEVFGTALVAPNIHRLREAHPELQLELAPESRAVNLSKREADIAISLRPPPRGRLITRRLMDYRLGLFASRSYLQNAPPISEPAQLPNHAFVGYIDDLLDIAELRFFEEFAPGASTVFRSSSVSAQQSAVIAGVGLGFLHLFAATDPDLVQILPKEIEIKRSYWLVFHADQQREIRIRAVIEFLDKLAGEYRSSR